MQSMDTFNWESRIREWSRKRIELLTDYEKAELPPEVLESGYLGYPGATEEQIARAEAYLGKALPPSYREFLNVSNGLRSISEYGIAFYSTETIDWYAIGDEPIASDNRKFIAQLIEDWKDPVPDEEYFIYGKEQSDFNFRPEYLKTALEISSENHGNIFLLNPQILTPDGDWEAWFCSFNSSFGITRYRSFRKLMEVIFNDPEFIG